MTTRILLAIGVPLFVAAGAWLYPKVKDRLSPTTPDEPGDDDREASGADEQFPDDLRAMRNAPVDPNLVSDTEMDLQWGLAWHAFEHDMQEEIDRVFAPLLAALPVADDFDELREQTCPKELMPA